MSNRGATLGQMLSYVLKQAESIKISFKSNFIYFILKDFACWQGLLLKPQDPWSECINLVSNEVCMEKEDKVSESERSWEW